MITSNTAGFSCESNLFCASCGAAVYDNAQRVRKTAENRDKVYLLSNVVPKRLDLYYKPEA